MNVRFGEICGYCGEFHAISKSVKIAAAAANFTFMFSFCTNLLLGTSTLPESTLSGDRVHSVRGDQLVPRRLYKYSAKLLDPNSSHCSDPLPTPANSPKTSSVDIFLKICFFLCF